MLEVRYIKETGQLTGWCGDSKQFRNLDRGRDTEAIIILGMPIPEKGLNAYLLDKVNKALVANPDYVEPVDRNPLAEIDKLETRLRALETQEKATE